MPPCTKKFYSTLNNAALALRGIRASGTRAETGIHPCSACHGFHLTSKRTSARNKWTVSAMKALGSPTVSA